jgi:transketolase
MRPKDQRSSMNMREMRIKILEASHVSKEGHIPSALSVLDLLYCIYLEFPATEDLELGKDYDFILSKGHASLALYAVLEEAGIIDNSWVRTFAKFDSDFGGHPDMRKVSGVSASTGSLGHGLPISIGKILANRILGKQKRVFCLIGDGEMNEGSIWESLLLASHHQLSELILLIDINHSTDRALNLGDVEAKMKAFGFQTVTVDGHDHEQILSALRSDSRMPTAIIAKTIKGYGIEKMESNPAWHHLSPSGEELIEMIRELR